METAHEQALTFKAHAKVNLCLSVQFPPVDGFHRLDSVFQELDLCDVVRMSVLDQSPDECVYTALGTAVFLVCALPGLRPQDNLIFKALDQAERVFGVPMVDAGQSLRIEVEKHIPAGGGLGGGSSDAAAMIKAYAQAIDIDFCDKRAIALAQSLGADVAFFLYGGAALMSGRGDVLESRLSSLRMPLVLMGDHTGMSTAKIYSAFDANPQMPPDSRALARAMQADPADGRRIADLCSNNLEQAACAQSERLRRRLEFARDHACVLNAQVTGSGATSFALCANKADAERFAHDIDPFCDWVRICEAR